MSRATRTRSRPQLAKPRVTYLIPDADVIAAARWAAITLLFPKLEELSERSVAEQAREQGLAPIWHHTWNSSGAILSERPW